MRFLVAAFLALIASSALAMVNIVETAQVTLVRGSTTVKVTDSWDSCKKLAIAKIVEEGKTRASGTATYKCQTERYQFVATFSPDPPPPPPPPACPSPPASQMIPKDCPAGTVGAWEQRSTSTVGPPPACVVTTTWAPDAPPAGACVVIEPPPPPPPPPPSGDTIKNGQAFTVTGSNFGTKAKAAPFVFDTFDVGTGSPGGKIATAGKWTACDWSSPVTYATHDGRKVAKHAFGGGTYNASLCADTVTSTFYLDIWVKAVPKANPSRNWKVWRTYSTGGSENGNTVYYCVGGGIDLGGWKWLPETPPPLGTWVHYQIVSTPSVTQHYRNGKLDHQGRGGAQIGEMRIGHYWGLDGVPECGSNPGADVYTEDAYFDTSVARVLLADAPILANAKLAAIQLPTAWADGSVTITPDTSRFKAGDKAYVIVVDGSNAQRKALEVTVQ